MEASREERRGYSSTALSSSLAAGGGCSSRSGGCDQNGRNAVGDAQAATEKELFRGNATFQKEKRW